nr:LysR family transcriptional regulator [Rhodococcus sp. (in: high G+C Gram-positive bacteria)]
MERPQIRELEYVVAVAEELSFTRAAARLGIAQPPLSRAIGLIERRLGTRLFERTSRSVVMTDAGAEFVHRARSILEAVDELVQQVNPTELVVAVRPSTGTGLLIDIQAALRGRPNQSLVRIHFTTEPDNDVRRGIADVALMCSTRDTSGLQTETLIEQPTIVLMPAPPFTPLPASAATMTLQDVRSSRGFTAECPAVSLDEIIDRVALQGISLLTSADIADRVGDRVAVATVPEAPPTVLILAWRGGSTHPARESFLRAAHRTAQRATLTSRVS